MKKTKNKCLNCGRSEDLVELDEYGSGEFLCGECVQVLKWLVIVFMKESAVKNVNILQTLVME